MRKSQAPRGRRPPGPPIAGSATDGQLAVRSDTAFTGWLVVLSVAADSSVKIRNEKIRQFTTIIILSTPQSKPTTINLRKPSIIRQKPATDFFRFPAGVTSRTGG